MSIYLVPNWDLPHSYISSELGFGKDLIKGHFLLCKKGGRKNEACEIRFGPLLFEYVSSRNSNSCIFQSTSKANLNTLHYRR